ncbi:MobC family plasmid mobilization relaxosome protein [Streptomyces fenghuangensis]|uniref:MobC family plasmid mobilization relaxosome protein n=1 Tax=Streptomyces sp. ICN903 TaxID=2964654 RepID=UPI001ED9C6C0|nr:MobC family plasmid mobilization relaxosome protein [Streptomyces sp. ICN903]MCG3039009.1 MobC family plasmid mobilization relaxosome protein [Streptomyces sp. ICN903]
MRHQGVSPGGEAVGSEPPHEHAPAFPDRPPRRRTYQRSHREAVIAVRFTSEEKAEIAAAAGRAGVFPAGFLATAGLTAARGRGALPRADEQLDAAIDELAALRAQIARVGNNLNQIARACNSGGRPHPGALDSALKTLVGTLGRVDLAADTLARRRTR